MGEMGKQMPGNAQPQDAAAAYYYTGDEGGSITKIDAATNAVVETIAVEGSVHNVQVSPDGKILGATVVPETKGHGNEEAEDHGAAGEADDGAEAMKMNGIAFFYDTATNRLINKVEVGSHPAHIVFTGDGKYALVSNNEDDTVTVIDAATYKVKQTIPTGVKPHGFRVFKDSKFAYVANMGEDTVSVLDLANLKQVKEIKVGQTPVTTGITSDGKIMVAALNAENALAVVDLATDKVEKIPVGEGPAQVYIQSDDKYAFVANQGTEEKSSNSVTKIDLATKQVVAVINTGKGAHGVVTSEDNKLVYVTNMFEDTVTVIDNDQNKVIKTFPVGDVPNGISFKAKN
ncbi:cytochrome D1 domain-containing protein [Paenibacillus sp. BR2-3]|uniref:YVTN family beta-propeller repeat protein n=1 Tax=Paenibacillus sp. BR2-3 TaxID=3048494 RepID=UPI0039776F2F